MKTAWLFLGLLTILSLNAFGQNRSVIPPIPDIPMTIGDATIQIRQGNFTANGQSDAFNFTAPRDGLYRFGMEELRANANVRILVRDRLDQVVADSGGGTGNGRGISVRFVGGQTYRVEVRQWSGLSPYRLEIGHQKETVDISRLTRVSDGIQFTEQQNRYAFTAPRDGLYRFEMAELRGNANVRIMAWDRLDQVVADSGGGTGNGRGISVRLGGGQTYHIQVRQWSGLSPYHLLIGHQKETVNITGLARVTDSIQFTEQQNGYTFTAPRDGLYRFEMAEMTGNANVRIMVWDRLDQLVTDSGGGTGNGRGISVRLGGGQTYHVQVRQWSGFSPYVLIVGSQ